MEFFQGSSPYYHANYQQFTSEKRQSDTKTDHFIVDDLLDFPTDDTVVEGGAFVADTSTDSSTAVDSCNSSSQCGSAEPSLPRDDGCRSFVDSQFSTLCPPYDDLAEFDWLSNFVEESFSTQDVQKLQLLSRAESRPENVTHPFQPRTINRTNNLIFNNDMTIPGKARTKRSRVTSRNWASQLPIMSPNVAEPVSNMSSNSKSDHNMYPKNEGGRKCLHCATNKTPQWRTGPMGPRTLCNACGVRYKSGRLLPEYRPAASPTFVLTKHSNSHRKVLELRRQKMQNTLHQDFMLQMPKANNYFIH
ncbi:hypothetical protein L1987_10038 [Smallanthus sonchifolius]|uniref:Uncharacterized protein n=1 Tax=Smallanthus sonchifolius TaxID=185202 RepID=A0ACB9JQZ7_9ASTR|nr:hypothetical protein L1987_10038 [Smallanthus sonchifolius]